MECRSFLVTFFFVLLATSLFAQERRPFSADDIEYLLRQSVPPKRVAALVEERGISFTYTTSRREKLRKAGADAALFSALEKASSKLSNRSKREILEVAKSEAKVVWYSSLLSPFPEELCNRFHARHPGIACEVHRSGSGNLYRRLSEEALSGASKADVVHTANTDDFFRLRRDGALARYRPEGAENLAAYFTDEDGYWTIMRAGLFLPAYSTRKFRSGDVPKSWFEFADPKYGELTIGDPISSGFVNVGLTVLANQFGWGLLDKLAARNPRISLSAVEAMARLRSGDAPMLFGAISYSIQQAISNGAPIGFVHPKEGLPFIPSPVGILTNAPHPNASMVFTDWLLTKEAQYRPVFSLKPLHCAQPGAGKDGKGTRGNTGSNRGKFLTADKARPFGRWCI